MSLNSIISVSFITLFAMLQKCTYKIYSLTERDTQERKKHVNRNAKAKCEEKTNKITTNYHGK